MPYREAPPPVWTGEAGLSYVQTSGNSNNSTLGASFKLGYEKAPWKLGLASGFVRSETDDLKTAERYDATLRAERGFGPRVAIYTQGAYLRNSFAGIDGQETLEAGGLYKLAVGPKHFFSTSAALAYTVEQRSAPSPDRNFVGGRGGLLYKWQISPSADFVWDLNYLQSFKDTEDGRVASSETVNARINKIFALKLGHQLLYSRDPVAGKKRTDTTVQASIVAKWPAPTPPPPCPCP